MTERPIIFSAPMVRAILAGRKTQTRRVVALTEFGPSDTPGYDFHFRDRRMLWNDVSRETLLAKFCPWNVASLWGRETFCLGDGMNPSGNPNLPTYRADWPDVNHGRWKPSIHMPRAAARIFLRVTGVRVERVQDISEADAQAEGVYHDTDLGPLVINPRLLFRELWDSLSAKRGYSWESNPWVWVVEFERVEP